MLHPAFGVMRPEELVFTLANSARCGIREPSVVDSIPKLKESDLPPAAVVHPASRTLNDSCCSRNEGTPTALALERTRRPVVARYAFVEPAGELP